MAPSLPYHEPSIETLLKQSSFLVVLNIVNYVFDALLYCGLVGQVLVGVAWGMPGGKLLGLETQQVIVQLGYIGLILIVFEDEARADKLVSGGLSTSFSSLKANLLLSTAVAITGIAAPIGLSFALGPMAGASPLQAFAAGAALSSTSLGTTFTLLGTSGLRQTRLGVVLTSAAMMDDVVGLIMVQIVANLGGHSSGPLDATTVVRPIFVSLAFAVLLPLACRFLVLPVTRLINGERAKHPEYALSSLLNSKRTAFTIHVAILVGMVAGATYAGTSSLLGAYLAGAIISWWDTEARTMRQKRENPGEVVALEGDSQHSDRGQVLESRVSQSNSPAEQPGNMNTTAETTSPNDGAQVFAEYCQPVLDRLLKPFFFASIGFSIPITKMFTGPIIWRGVVYSILMALGKLICGLWLIRLPSPIQNLRKLAKITTSRLRFAHKPAEQTSSRSGPSQRTLRRAGAGASQDSASVPKPLSVYPGLILGCAMMSRGEIGYLISSVAEGRGIFGSVSASAAADEPSELFLIVTWAITLCTVAGPITMGLLVDRVRKLESSRGESNRGNARPNVLGVWGVESGQ